MITAERLKELIEKETTIYSVQNNKIFEIELKKDFFEDDDTLTIRKFNIFDECLELNNDNGESEHAWLIEYLFETKPKAEFYAKYGNVEKTVKMPVPPTWEEFNKKNMYRNGKCFLFHHINLDGTDSLDINYGKYKFEFSEQGYTKALDKMVELWKEEI